MNGSISYHSKSVASSEAQNIIHTIETFVFNISRNVRKIFTVKMIEPAALPKGSLNVTFRT